MLDSPFQNILHTNAVPSDADCQRIRDFLTEPRRELADLSDEISRMQKLMDELIQKRAALDDFINAHLAMVSPARRVPDDIIRAIFVACLPSLRNPVITSDEPPLLLCQICSPWRCLALSTPRLWAAMHVVLPTQSKLQILAEIVTDWLDRSGVLPLSVSVVLSRTWTREDDALPLLTGLMSVSRRWQHMQFYLWSHRALRAFKNLRPDDVPMLQSLTMHGSDQRSSWGMPNLDEDPDPMESYEFLSFLNTPNLRNVSIPGGRDMHTLPLSWAHLRSLAIDRTQGSISYNAACAILRQCPALETCELGLRFIDPAADNATTISLPRLRHLSIIGDPRGHPAAGALFRLLFLPNLRSLEYSQWSSIGDSFPFSSLLAGTSSLERFSLHLMDVPNNAPLTACLEAMPLLQYFRLTVDSLPGDGISHEFVAQLTPNLTGSDPILCPLLTSLDLSILNENVTDEALLRLVQARAQSEPRGVTPLSCLNCTLARDKQVDLLPLLKKEISMGLVASFEYRPLFRHSYSPTEGTDRWKPANPNYWTY
ncbi:hypothetical protein FB451DRAFT_1227677 [Mycena latifolia]|nr:hypothetical protein FB451DRAFT_1227677 [Mycena latifolia]